MIKKINALMIGTAMLLMAGNAFAGSVWTPNYYMITQLVATTTGLSFDVDGYSHYSSTCNGGKRFNIHTSHANYKVTAAAVTSAYLAKKRIKFTHDVLSTPVCAPNAWIIAIKD